VVHDARTGTLLADEHVTHCYRMEEGLIARMDVQPDP
jgi:hypothetical protein